MVVEGGISYILRIDLYPMLRNYLITAFRNLWKYRFYSSLNILGLGIGIASSLLMLSFVRSEFSYDRFHPDHQNIYRLVFDADISGTLAEFPVVGYPWLDWILEEVPQVESGTNFFGGWGEEILLDEQVIWEDNVIYTDSTFSDIFLLDWISGNNQHILNAPGQAIITQSIAKKFFGLADPIGKTLTINHLTGKIPITVSGLIKDYPDQSHFSPGLLVSITTLQQAYGMDHPIFQRSEFTSFYTYIKTKEPDLVQTKLTDLYDRRMDDAARERIKGINLQALTDIHLHSHTNIELKPNGNILYVRIFLWVGILVLFIATINYINLATAIAAVRVKEVGVRKAVGALGKNIRQQFLSEAGLLVLLGLAFGLLLTELIRGLLGLSMGIYIGIGYFSDPFILLLLLAYFIFIGLLAGSFPAFFLARLKPVEILGSTISIGKGGKSIRSLLLFFQFAIATSLIIGAGIISRQLYFIEHMDMGFERKERVIIPAPILSDPGMTSPLLERLKKEAKQLPGVINACITGPLPGDNRNLINIRLVGRPETEVYSPTIVSIGYDYVETMGLDILHGRNFDSGFGEDNSRTVLVNETAITHMRLDSPYVNSELLLLPQEGTGIDSVERVKIVGVFKDMHFEPLYRSIHPMLLRVETKNFYYLVVHIQPDNQEISIAGLKEIWESQVKDVPFEFTLLEEDLAAIYNQEEQLGKLINLLTILAILIAFLGLFSLSAFTTVKRQKEIMIRKAIGANVSDIILLLSKPFLLLILFAFPFAALLAWWATKQWLETFAYHSSPGIIPYLIALILILLVGFITVSFNSYKAANGNPADYLREE